MRKHTNSFILGAVAATTMVPLSAAAQCGGSGSSSPPFIGEIGMFAGNFAPRGSVFANGQLLRITDYQALFSIFGTTYGGDGRTTFGVPNLNGRIPIHRGQGPGLVDYPLGSRSGAETNTLTRSNMPSHTHSATTTMTLRGTSARGRKSEPDGRVLANDGADRVYNEGPADVNMSGQTVRAETGVNATGGGTPVNNMMPYLAVNYIVCIDGVFPSRS